MNFQPRISRRPRIRSSDIDANDANDAREAGIELDNDTVDELVDQAQEVSDEGIDDGERDRD